MKFFDYRKEYGSKGHHFRGYGYFVDYCPSCCPKEHEDIICNKEHPNEQPTPTNECV